MGLDEIQQMADNKYYNEQYPITAKICDLNKCLLIFQNIKWLLNGLDVFVGKIRQNQCGNIVSIVCSNNGFKTYTNNNFKKVEYTNIKLNVLIQGQRHHIIGQIEFIFEEMYEYFERTKYLKQIEKQKEFMDKSVVEILPQLLDHNKELFIAGLYALYN